MLMMTDLQNWYQENRDFIAESRKPAVAAKAVQLEHIIDERSKASRSGQGD